MIALNSIYLLGLLGIIVPIFIHLWSKKNKQPIPFGSIRFIAESTQRSIRKIIPTDLWLFLLRALIVGAIVAFISDIRFDGWEQKERSTFWVDSTFVGDPLAMERIKALSDTAEVKWLPKMPIEKRLSHYQMISKASDQFIVPMHMAFLPEHIEDLSDLNLQAWPLPDQDATVGIASIGGSTVAITGHFSETKTTIDHQAVSSDNIATLKYFLTYDTECEEVKKILMTAIETINEMGIYRLVEVTTSHEADVLFWLTDHPVPIFSGKQIIINNQVSSWLNVSKQLAFLNSTLTPEQALNSMLANHLYQWLDPFQKVTDRLDRRFVLLKKKSTSDNPTVMTSAVLDLRIYWWLLLIVLIAIERLVSLK
jgi:hypothetical protein